jgi:hypothetical protein
MRCHKETVMLLLNITDAIGLIAVAVKAKRVLLTQ